MELSAIEEKTGIDRTSLREIIEEMAFGGEISANLSGSTLKFRKIDE